MFRSFFFNGRNGRMEKIAAVELKGTITLHYARP
jgi:hypothetical protein